MLPGPNTIPHSPGDGSCTTDPCWYHVANATDNAGVTLQLLE